LAEPYKPRASGRGRRTVSLLLLAASTLLLANGCGLDHYEQLLEAEQKRLKYLDDENQNLEGSPLKLPEKKGEDKEAVPEKDFFFRPPKGISTTPEPKALGILYRYPATNPNGNLQDLLVAVVKTKEGADKFRKDVLQNLQSLGLIVAGQTAKTRDAGGALAGNTVHYDVYELQGAPNQPGGSVYFYRGEVVQGEGAYQVALVFRTAPSQAGIANDSPLLELTLASLRVNSAAQAQQNRFRPVPQSGSRNRR
jgi:hypothetical protein